MVLQDWSFSACSRRVRCAEVYGIDLPRKEDLIANGRDEDHRDSESACYDDV